MRGRSKKSCACGPGKRILTSPGSVRDGLQEDVAVEAGRGGAGMDGQDAQAGACGQGGAGRPADDAVLLVGLRDAQTGDQLPRLVADEPVAEGIPLPGQARIA